MSALSWHTLIQKQYEFSIHSKQLYLAACSKHKNNKHEMFKKQSVILSLKTPCIHVPYTCKAPLQAHRHPKPLPGAHPHAAWPWCWLGFLGDFDHFFGSHPSLGRSIERRLPNYLLMHRCNGSFFEDQKERVVFDRKH